MTMNTRYLAQQMILHGVFVDTETTGLGDDDAAIEVAAVHGGTGEVLFESLIATQRTVSDEAASVHGITPAMLRSAPDAAAVIERLEAVLMGRAFVAFNAAFDLRMLRNTVAVGAHVLSNPYMTTYCAMEIANRHLVSEHGEWNHERSCFRRMSLARCCEIAGVAFSGRAHRAAADAKATRDLMVAIASGDV